MIRKETFGDEIALRGTGLVRDILDLVDRAFWTVLTRRRSGPLILHCDHLGTIWSQPLLPKLALTDLSKIAQVGLTSIAKFSKSRTWQSQELLICFLDVGA
jgi:hypothetical protein